MLDDRHDDLVALILRPTGALVLAYGVVAGAITLLASALLTPITIARRARRRAAA
jgi:hypothetical protein